MARAYSPKKIEVIFEQVETTPEEVEQKVSEAYAILFEETMKYLKEKKVKKNNDSSLFNNSTQRGGDEYSAENNIYK